jgi:hypothetical protein
MTFITFAWLLNQENFQEIIENNGDIDYSFSEGISNPININTFNDYISIDDWIKN